MTIVQTAAVLEAALIALLLMLQFRRARDRQAPATRDAPINPGPGAARPPHRPFPLTFDFLRARVTRVANATREQQAAGAPAEQPCPREAPGSRQYWRQSWRPIRARLAAAERFRRIAVHLAPHDVPTQASGDLHESPREETLRRTLELLPFAILMTNAHGRIVLANAGVETLFGYRQDELIGASADTLVPGLQGATDPARRARTVHAPPAGATGGTRDLFARRKDGTEFPAEITANRTSSDGAPLTLTVIIDRTERYELQRNRQELAHLTRVSTLGELASSLAHELNQPLTAILSNAQAAQRFMATQPINLAEVREILRDLVEDNHRASEVLRRIRALVKKGELEAAPLSLARVIGDVVLLVHSDAIVRGIRVLPNINASLPPVQGDSVQVQQVVLNLLLNAFHATESRSAHDREIVVDAALDGAGMVRVSVRDRGPGLAADKLDKLFKPFYTSKRDGLGLGLSISRTIVEMHGGRIWAENNTGQGATFHFTLPIATEAEPIHSGQRP